MSGSVLHACIHEEGAMIRVRAGKVSKHIPCIRLSAGEVETGRSMGSLASQPS